MRGAAARVLDGSAIGLSGLCLVHCLLLPVAVALLPVLGAWAEAEWVHGVFVLVAAPLSALALLRRRRSAAGQRPLMLLAGLGVALLALGAFTAPDHRSETAITVAGSLCLAAAHLWNWRRRAATPHEHAP